MQHVQFILAFEMWSSTFLKKKKTFVAVAVLDLLLGLPVPIV